MCVQSPSKSCFRERNFAKQPAGDVSVRLSSNSLASRSLFVHLDVVVVCKYKPIRICSRARTEETLEKTHTLHAAFLTDRRPCLRTIVAASPSSKGVFLPKLNATTSCDRGRAEPPAQSNNDISIALNSHRELRDAPRPRARVAG